MRSDRSRVSWLMPLLIELIIGATFSLPAVLSIDIVSRLQLAAADTLFLHESGPHLGYRPHRQDVVLIPAIGNTTIADDVLVYQRLLEAGAIVVADPRPLPNPDDGQFIVRELEKLPQAAGHVFRNIQLPDHQPPFLSESEKTAYVGGDVIFTDAAHDVNQVVRYYPLIFASNDGFFDETLALKTARVALGGQPIADAFAAARASGVLGDWVRRIANGNESQAGKDDERIAPVPYPLDSAHRIPWVSHRSIDTPALISPAGIWINYRAAPGTAAKYSYAEVLKGALAAGALRGKIAVIDDTASLWTVPTTTRTETWGSVDAQVVEQILDGTYLQAEPPIVAIAAVLLLALAGVGAFTLGAPLRAFVIAAAVFLLYLGAAVLLYRAGSFPDLVLAPAALVTSSAVSGGRRYLQETLERRRIYDLFGRYVPRSVVAELVRRPADAALALGGAKRDLTVLFADVRGFTSMSEHLPPEQVLSRLNVVLSALVRSAFEQQGTVDKYIGDAVMVLFNAPLEQPDHVVRAVRSALRMQTALAGNDLAVGIGIHTGEAVVGNVGTVDRLEYTAIGATVNLSARLCESAGKGEVIVSAAVRQALGDRLDAEARPPISLKGLDPDLITYRVNALRD